MRLTDGQAAAVAADSPAVAVVAGAGTGKTHVLTARYLGLLDQGVSLPRILALTFTEKAAREMKQRIGAALRDRGRKELARQAEFAPISTIHAFLSRVLRERALDSGIDPRAVIADEVTADFFMEQALAATVDGLDDETRAALVDMTGGEENLLWLYEAARATPHALGDLRPVEPDLRRLGERMAAFLHDCAPRRASGRTGQKLDTLRALRDGLLDLDPDLAGEFREAVKGNVTAAERDLFREGKRIADEYDLLPHLERARRTGAAVVATLRGLDEAYTERKRAEGLIDFADLEREGLRLLRSEAGQAVVAEYDHVLVDEYQDTSRIQEAILDELAQGRSRFGVGDAKQSIYRFRYADASVFAKLQETAECYPLADSFRSRPELVSFTNRLFRELFSSGDVKAQDLEAVAEWRPKEQPCVEVATFHAKGAASGRRTEARAVARRLREIVEGGSLRRTSAEEPDRPLGYRDCALLLRAMSNLHVYERALADEGVPYVVVKGRGYYAAREVVDLAHLLLLLHDPSDRYRAVAAMTSLLCGAPETDLAHLPGNGPLPLRARGATRPDAIPPARWERLTTFAERFERWRGVAARVPTGDLVETILAETRFPDLLLLEYDGRRRHANLMKVLRRARQTQEDPTTYARALLEFRERELRESEAPVASETDEAVKVMTIHAAKGLEFPLVAVADVTARPPTARGPILRPDGVFAFRLRDDDDSVKPPGYDDLRRWDTAQEDSERLRLWYVALTRAQEHLLLSGSRYRHAADPFLERLETDAPPGVLFHDVERLVAGRRGPARDAGVRAAVRRGAPLPARVERDEEGARELLERIDAIRVPPADDTPYVVAVADLVEFERCPRRYRLTRMLGIEYDEPAGGGEASDSEEHPRRELGTKFHEIMKEIGPGAIPDEATVRKHFPEAKAQDVAKIVGWSEWLADQEMVRGISGLKQHKEMPFLTRVAGLPVRGVIDLYVPDGPLLVDYKTGAKVRPGEYEVQVAVYLAALRSLRFAAPDRAHLLYVDAEEIVTVKEEPVDPLIERFQAAHRATFPAKPGDACFHCEFRTACKADGVPVPSPGLFD